MKHILFFLILFLSACAPPQSGDQHTVKIVEAVITYPRVVELIRPNLAGRVPVKVALEPPHHAALGATSLGGRVVSTNQLDPQAMVLGVAQNGNEAKVSVEYRPEQAIGLVVVSKINGTWMVTAASFWEQRSNNSFKPTQLRGVGKAS